MIHECEDAVLMAAKSTQRVRFLEARSGAELIRTRATEACSVIYDYFNATVCEAQKAARGGAIF